MNLNREIKIDVGFASWIVGGIWIGVFLGLVAAVKAIWPSSIPLGLFELWTIKKPILGAVMACWPAFVWGGGVTLVFSYLAIRRGTFKYDRYDLGFGKCLNISLFAGITEEIIFRWLMFYMAIATLPLWNWLFFGWAGFGLPEWLFSHIAGPVANFFTLGKLSAYLNGSMGWVMGAAVLSANANFRNNHKYLGFFGYVNSWFMGMLFFWLMFQYGILAAIVAHFLYDLLVFWVASAMARLNTEPSYARTYA